MLNPALYRSLQRVTRAPVKIKDEDVEAVFSVKKNRTAEGVELAKEMVSPGEEYICCCPFCNDEHYHLSVNHLYGTDKVGKSTNLVYCYHGCLSDIDKLNEFRHRVLGFTNRTDVPYVPKVVKRVEYTTGYEKIDHVLSIRDLNREHRAIQYLVDERGFDLDTLIKYDVGYCLNSSNLPRISGKIIIPIMLNGEQVGWQARYVGTPPPGVPKYFTAPGMHKGAVLYNFDIARHQPYIVLTEGVMDAWRVGDSGVCSFGKCLSVGQANLLADNCIDKTIVLMYDNDLTEREERKTISRLLNLGLRVIRVNIPEGYKDPDSMSTEMIKSLIEQKINGKGKAI